MLTILFTVIIYPITQLLGAFYLLFKGITNKDGISVVGLSLVVTICTLPLYVVAERWQEIERLTEEKLKAGVARIKRCFKGDERFMILSTYYRQNHYHPLMALRSSFGLLIQIPFFIAAYHFLSHLESLKGVSFLFVNDLGAPDRLFVVGNFGVNVLPILMTAINCVSGAIYSKGHGVREKVQIFGLAAIFLVLLYNSPAGLVIYWTMNNVFSLVKNVFYKLKNLKRVLFVLVCVAAVFCCVSCFTVLRNIKNGYRMLLFCFGVIVLVCMLCSKKALSLLDSNLKQLDNDKNLRLWLFALSAVLLSLLSGAAIPSMLMQSEPVNYCYVDDVVSPFFFLRRSILQALGLFVFWPCCFFALFSEKVKKAFCLIFSFAAIATLVNVFAFSGEYGPILPECIFMEEQTFNPTLPSFLLNLFVLLVAFALVCLILQKWPRIMSGLSTIAIISLFILCCRNVFQVREAYKTMTPPIRRTDVSEIKPVYHLSKEGKNVIVVMQDRLFMPMVERCFDKKPEFRQIFDGFTFYKNAVSFGRLTITGATALFGGYSFSPYEINLRTDQTMQEKHNQALLTLPVVFHEAGFDTTVSGLPYENYLEYPIEAMYEGYEYITRAETRGAYSDIWYAVHGIEKVQFIANKIERNLVWFSLFKMVPPILRRAVYNKGYWTVYDEYDDGITRFIDNYSEMDFLPEFTDAQGQTDSFIMIDNETAHEPITLSPPDYIPTGKEGSVVEGGQRGWDSHFSTTMGLFNLYEDFFAHLKQLGVYDNTRIIIVSDHGAVVDSPELRGGEKLNINKNRYVASILVKDFGERGEVKTDMTFMTNADTPYLATKGIVPDEDAKNPFTGLPFKIEDKAPYVKLLNGLTPSTKTRKKSTFFAKKGDWFTVKDNIFVPENWSQLEGK